MRSTWAFVWIIGVMFLVHCAARAAIGLTKLQQRADIVRIRDRDRSAFEHLRVLDQRALPMNVVLVGSAIVAWALLILWGRRVLRNHHSLRRVDDRAFVRGNDFFGIAALALRGIDGKPADPKLPRHKRRMAGGRIATTWSRLFNVTLLAVLVAQRLFATKQPGETVNQIITRLGRSSVINFGEALLLLVTAGAAILAMIEIGEGQSALADVLGTRESARNDGSP